MKKKLIALLLAIAILIPAASAFARERYTKREASFSKELSLNIDDRFVDINVKSGRNDEIQIQMMENEHYKYTLEEKDGELNIVCNDESTWLDKFFQNVSDNDRELNITLPKDYQKSISIKCMFGELDVEDAAANDLSANLQYTDGDFKNVKLGGGIAVISQYGDIEMDVLSAQAVAINAEYSELELKNCEIAQGAAVITKYGDTEINKLSFGEKFILSGSYSRLSFRNITFGARMEITSDFGDINGRLPGKNGDYTISCETSFGDSNLPSKSDGGAKELIVSASYSDVSVSFGK
ncbi:MAG: DUF4097 family beta strand repeat-containing protein [Eubacteriales bacterium]|nr:DUF4097 family beta strand repeat-containing protein [Eubacteriales bacterium]MDD3880909.1 DUF4097 family beta strand repeat-containing protein [Eubacteriales bacterium]MDD4511724.1 DUF4097 family beta strand repeat-containing protein [Eubacteriales bacterium]